MKTANSLSWLVAVAGLWEFLSPFILGYSTATVALWNAVIVGIVLVVLAGWAALSPDNRTDRNLEWINVVIGAWLLVSPFILAFSAISVALWNSIIVGLVVIVLAVWAASLYSQLTASPS